MLRFSLKHCSLIALVAILYFQCVRKKNKDELPNDDPGSEQNVLNRSAMLLNYADQLILPGYDLFKAKFDTMLASSQAFANNPEIATLLKLRQDWQEAYIEWQKVELFELYDNGPAVNYSLRNRFNIYPASANNIEANIVNGNANLQDPANNPAQGFPALDYLINGLGTDDQIVARYKTAADAPKRLAYLKQVTDQMSYVFNAVLTEWVIYRSAFVSNPSVDNGSPLSSLVNGYVMYYERYLRTGKLGLPTGIMDTARIIRPELVEAFYKKDISVVLAKTAHKAVVDFFNGKSVKSGIEGASLKTYLNQLGAKDNKTGNTLSDIINTQFALVHTRLDALSNNLSQEIQTNNQAPINAYLAMQTAVRMLKGDMLSAMTISVVYGDNDGD